ncbi:MAG TPA: hypothetical protein VKZ69_00950 [Limnochordales bacterium]|nr:hypothetical protein [Limnochordales bacterium]
MPVSGNRIAWWWELRMLVAFVLWFLVFERLWDMGRLWTGGQAPGMAAVGNALLLLALALAASWNLPLYPPR